MTDSWQSCEQKNLYNMYKLFYALSLSLIVIFDKIYFPTRELITEQ